MRGTTLSTAGLLTEAPSRPAAESLGRPPAVLEPERRQAAFALQAEFLAAADRRDPRFAHPDLVELFLESSAAAQLADPQSAAVWAGHAVFLAGRRAAEDRLDNDSRVRALRLLANAQRLLGETEEAQDTLSEALDHLSGGSPEQAYFHTACGLLQRDLWRPPCAIAHFHEAARLFFDAGAMKQQGTCLLLSGLVHAANDAATPALLDLLEGRRQAEAELHPRLSLLAGLAYARLVAEIGQAVPARQALDEALELGAHVRTEGERLQMRRLEAAVRTRLGETGLAETLLREVLDRELERQDLAGSTLAALELSVVLKLCGRGELWLSLSADLTRLDDEVGEAFAAATLAAFWNDVSQGWAPSRAASRAAAEFFRQCRIVEIPLGEPFPFS